MQRDLADLSAHSRHLTATGSGHSIMVERPALVVETGRQLVMKQRQAPLKVAGFGNPRRAAVKNYRP